MKSRSRKLLCGRLFEVHELTYPDADGQLHVRQVVRHPGSVVVVPIVDAHRVCLIRNYRCAIDETLIELPAGTREAGEEPAVTAARELREETGFRAGRLRYFHDFYPAPGILDEHMTLYVAEDLEPGEPQREAGEEIENLQVTWQEARRMVRDHTIRDAKTIIGLMLAAPHTA